MQAMDISTNYYESSKQVKYAEGIDRISSLPDKILGHILSFLPTKHAVGTSILSRRWLHLFTLITNFDFDETLVLDRKNYMNGDALLAAHLRLRRLGVENDVKLNNTFKSFEDRVLMLCKSTYISKFRLNCRLGFDCSNVNTWIRIALLRGVTELDINTCEFYVNVLPLSLFVSETLVVLKVRGEFKVKLPAYVHLPHLKFLQLYSVNFSEDSSLNRLLSGCPMLKDLVLKGGCEDAKFINISSSTVTNLIIDFSDIFMSCNHRTNVEIDLPNLLHFNYIDYLATHYCIKNLNSLEDARIDIALDIENAAWDSFSDSVIELINGVSNARHLFLSGKCMEALTCGQFKLPTFNNMSCLEIGWSSCVNWREVLPDFLHSSPMLENLIFPEGLVHRESDGEYADKNFWGRLRKSPSCLSSQLKSITIEFFHGFDEELKLTKYLLRHGKVLKKLILYCQIRSDKKYQELMKLLKIGRSVNKECSIELRGY